MTKQQERFYDRSWDDALMSLDEIRKNKQKYREPVCGIYFLFKKNKLIYIGQSKNCLKRLAAHIKTGKNFDSYFVIDTEEIDDFERLELEAKYIFKYKPPLNKDAMTEARRRMNWIRTELQ